MMQSWLIVSPVLAGLEAHIPRKRSGPPCDDSLDYPIFAFQSCNVSAVLSWQVPVRPRCMASVPGYKHPLSRAVLALLFFDFDFDKWHAGRHSSRHHGFTILSLYCIGITPQSGLSHPVRIVSVIVGFYSVKLRHNSAKLLTFAICLAGLKQILPLTSNGRREYRSVRSAVGYKRCVIIDQQMLGQSWGLRSSLLSTGLQ
ncbi:hypothetical protein GGR55DRAFT_449679 [Xylaria sp. FL0064]|nr:hypothetical protein GGR55DRAFT_449679 [Xylaria sp. FL0064]